MFLVTSDFLLPSNQKNPRPQKPQLTVINFDKNRTEMQSRMRQPVLVSDGTDTDFFVFVFS